MLNIKILGSGCPNCRRLEQETRDALAAAPAPIPFEITKVTDYADIAAYNVMSTPALVINETVVSAGRIPKRQQIIEWAQQFLAQP